MLNGANMAMGESCRPDLDIRAKTVVEKLAVTRAAKYWKMLPFTGKCTICKPKTPLTLLAWGQMPC